MDRDDLRNMKHLRKEWAIYGLVSGLFLLGLFTALQQSGSVRSPLIWLAAAGALAAYQQVELYRLLPQNRPSIDAPLFPTLGLANWLTMSRSLLNAALAGFLFFPGPLIDRGLWPLGWVGWLPGLLYLSSSIIDYLDGYAARVTGRTTMLGETLDMNWDGAGMLMASFLAVRYGQAPLPYLLVGLARYLFVFGMWLRRRQGLPNYEMLPNRFRRPIAGMEMGYVAVILLPIFSPPATQIAGVLFMTPLVFSFLRDWLTVSGHAGRSALPEDPGASPFWKTVRLILPLAVRVAVAALLVYVLLDPQRINSTAGALLLIAALAVPALLLGVAGRVVALAVLLMSGFTLQIAPLDARFWSILLLSTLLFMTGTGRFSLWKPEEWLIDHRAGER